MTTKKTTKKKVKLTQFYIVSQWVGYRDNKGWWQDCQVKYLAKKLNKAMKRDIRVQYLALVECPHLSALPLAKSYVNGIYYTTPSKMELITEIKDNFVEHIYNASLV
jgi:hypothetical protein